MRYYDISTGFFPVSVKACFSKRAFHKIVKDHGLPIESGVDAAPLEKGVAETHTFTTPAGSFVVVVYNLTSVKEDIVALAGIVAHETCHVIERVLEYVGEQVEDFGEETRAYLTQYLVEQMYQAAFEEMYRDAKRKGGRKQADKEGQGAGGTVPEVGEPKHDGGSGQGSDIQGDLSGGTKRPKRKAVPEAGASS